MFFSDSSLDSSTACRGPHGGRHDRSSGARLRGDAIREELLVGRLLDRLSACDVPSHSHGAAPFGAPLGIHLITQDKSAGIRGFRRFSTERLLTEQIAVRAGTGKREHQHIIFYTVNEEPVRQNMTLSKTRPIAG